MNVWEIIEAIDDPSGLIHPEKHQAFARQTHPLAKHPAYPDTPPQAGGAVNYEEILASRQWQKILQKANQYLGVPLTRQALPVIQQKLRSAMGIISDAESRYKEELEALAVELVFELPEFKSAKKAYETNRVKIEADLTEEPGGMEPGMKTSDEPEGEEKPVKTPRTPAEEEWFKKTVQRRHFTNALIQGSAVSNNYLFELAGQTLDRIHPDLRNAYGILIVSSELGYWMFPQSMVLAGARRKTHIGASQVDVQQGTPTVRASGYCLPVLIQEIIKGLTELASLPSLPRDPVEREEVIHQADLVDLEAWSMMLGPKLWDNFIEAVDASDERELAMHLYRHVQTMDVDEFNAFMKEVLAKSPRGMQMLRELATRIKAELANQQGMEEAQQIVSALLDD